MILLPESVTWAAQVASAMLLVLILSVLTRAVWRISPALGLLAAGVIAARVVLAVTLLVISSLDLPLLRGLHTGDGFWTLSGDSRVYYELGLTGAHQGLAAIAPGSPSPAYTRLLAAWLWGAGPWMFVAIALNAVIYALMVLALARACLTGRQQVPLPGVVLSLSALSLSPILMFCSTQILKDVVFSALLVLFVLTVRNWLPQFKALLCEARATSWFFVGLGLMLINVLLIAGIRAYYGLFLILGLCLPLGTWALIGPARYAVPRIGAAFTVVCLLWGAFAVGAGVYYEPYGAIVGRVVQRVSGSLVPSGQSTVDAGTTASEPAVVGALDRARRGFIASGGNTNLVGPASDSTAPTRQDVDEGDPPEELTRPSNRVKSTAVGLAVIFLPLSLLEPLGVVDLSLGRGATLVSDADTVFVLLTILLLGSFARAASGRVSVDWALAAFIGTVAIVALVLIAYVVTNVGTLTRLRVPALVFLWLLPLATRVRPLTVGTQR